MSSNASYDPNVQPTAIDKESGLDAWAGATAGVVDAESANLKAQILKTRRAFGYAAVIVGSLGILVLGGFSFIHLERILPTRDTPFHGDTIVVAALGAHAVVTVALVWFCYQMIKAGERMLIPHWLARRPKDVEMVRALTGVEPPIGGALKLLKELKSLLNPLETNDGKSDKTAS